MALTFLRRSWRHLSFLYWSLLLRLSALNRPRLLCLRGSLRRSLLLRGALRSCRRALLTRRILLCRRMLLRGVLRMLLTRSVLLSLTRIWRSLLLRPYGWFGLRANTGMCCGLNNHLNFFLILICVGFLRGNLDDFRLCSALSAQNCVPDRDHIHVGQYAHMTLSIYTHGIYFIQHVFTCHIQFFR
jgi:hypothetical protein